MVKDLLGITSATLAGWLVTGMQYQLGWETHACGPCSSQSGNCSSHYMLCHAHQKTTETVRYRSCLVISDIFIHSAQDTIHLTNTLPPMWNSLNFQDKRQPIKRFHFVARNNSLFVKSNITLSSILKAQNEMKILFHQKMLQTAVFAILYGFPETTIYIYKILFKFLLLYK